MSKLLHTLGECSNLVISNLQLSEELTSLSHEMLLGGRQHSDGSGLLFSLDDAVRELEPKRLGQLSRQQPCTRQHHHTPVLSLVELKIVNG